MRMQNVSEYMLVLVLCLVQRSTAYSVGLVLLVLEFIKILNFSNWILALDVN